jgi:large subunit ribosomal protein L25
MSTEEKILTGELRTELGTASSRRSRRDGKIPAVIYGKHKPLPILLDAAEFQTKIRNVSESGLLTVKVGKNKHSVLIKDFQDDIIKKVFLHIDFFEVTKGEKLHMSVPVVLTNSHAAVGVKLGGVMEQIMHEVEIECLPKDIPEHITCDIKSLGINESIDAVELVLPEGVRLLTEADRTIVTITSHREAVSEEEEAEEEGEVEVIKEVKETE